MVRAGDAADLVRHGTPVGVVGAGGLVLLGAGLYLWHGMGRREMTNDETRMTNQ
jgi:hypothetical protein